MTRRTDNAVVGWMIAAGFALGWSLVPSAPARSGYSHNSVPSYRSAPERRVAPEPACPKGQDIGSVTFSRGIIVGVTCAQESP
jgi:hypothetical protein